MRFVVACCWAPDKGQGISTMSREIASCLAVNGDEVYYLSPKTEDISWHEKTGVIPLFIGHELTPEQGLIEVISKVNALQPDALINNDHPYVQAALPALTTKKIVISHTMAWSTASLARFNHRFADNIIAISYDMLLLLLKKGVSPTKLSFVMNGIVDPYQDNWQPIEHTIEPLNLFFAGNWTSVKGAELIMDFILSMPNDVPWLKLDIFGSIKTKDQQKITQKTWVNVHGRVSQNLFLDALEKSDMLLLPSKIEGCPMTVIEAMSRGVVPIVSDGYGSMKWMVDHGIDGYVVRRNNWTIELKQIIEYMSQNRSQLHNMRCQSRFRFNRQFNLNHLIKHIKNITSQPTKADAFRSESYPALKWHRPMNDSKSMIDKVLQRIYYKFGLLKIAGWVSEKDTKINSN